MVPRNHEAKSRRKTLNGNGELPYSLVVFVVSK